MKIKLQPLRKRLHQALFNDELPFKHRVEKSKKQYSRKDKYKVDYRLQEA